MDKLNPTLWRTCRVLAGRTRIRLLRQIFEHPGQSVSEMARHAGVGQSDASQELRRLQSRGLLHRELQGARVVFRPLPDPQVPTAAPLLKALQSAMQQFGPKRDDTICRLAAALAHDRRVRMARLLRSGPVSLSDLAKNTGIPLSGLRHHLRPMQEAGWLLCSGPWVLPQTPRHPMAIALLKLL